MSAIQSTWVEAENVVNNSVYLYYNVHGEIKAFLLHDALSKKVYRYKSIIVQSNNVIVINMRT